MTIRKLHETTDRESSLFDDVSHNPIVAAYAPSLLYCDTMQLAYLSETHYVITAIPSSHRLCMFLSKNGSIRHMADIRNVFSLVGDEAHARLCVCILRSCGLDVSSIGIFFGENYDPEQDDGQSGSAFFACCHSNELKDIRARDFCSIPYGDILDVDMLATMLPFIRMLTVYTVDFLPKCTSHTLQLMCVTDTVVCHPKSAIISRDAVHKILKRYARGSGTEITMFLSRFFPLNGTTNRLFFETMPKVITPKLQTEVKSEDKKGDKATLYVDADTYSTVYMDTRSGCGVVVEVRDYSTKRIIDVGASFRVLPRDSNVFQIPLTANVAGISDNQIRLSFPSQPDVLRELENSRKYVCSGNDKAITKQQCESDGRGSWDRPCVADDDCPFPKLGCTDGAYCGMPVGVKRFGFRKFSVNTRDSYPLCRYDQCDPILISREEDVPNYVSCCVKRL